MTRRSFLVSVTTCVVLAMPSATFAQAGLVGELSKNLGVTTQQATGGAGALFGLAKSQLSASEFGTVSAAVPGIDGLLKAAPAADTGGLTSALGAKAGGLASLAAAFTKLGLKPTDAARFAPEILKLLNNRGAAEAAKLLSAVWK